MDDRKWEIKIGDALFHGQENHETCCNPVGKRLMRKKENRKISRDVPPNFLFGKDKRKNTTGVLAVHASAYEKGGGRVDVSGGRREGGATGRKRCKGNTMSGNLSKLRSNQ